jgi:hypothetical protein
VLRYGVTALLAVTVRRGPTNNVESLRSEVSFFGTSYHGHMAVGSPAAAVLQRPIVFSTRTHTGFKGGKTQDLSFVDTLDW